MLFAVLLFAIACKSEKTVVEEVAIEANIAPEWSKNANMYEVNVRQYSEEGTFNEFAKSLPRLKKMGVDILWFMPIHPIGVKNRKGTMGSYYSVRDYKDVDPSYGTKADFKKLVDEAHAQGMKVIIDWVANHTAFDNVWVEAGHTDYYTPDSNGNLQPPIGTDWWDVADLNYDNKEMRKAMIDAMLFWVEEYNIDGYRCDVASWAPDDFWDEASVALKKANPEIFMLAEAEHPPHHEKAFHANYGWDFHHRMNKIAKGEEDVSQIKDYIEGNAKNFPKETYRLHFTSNHDENSWNGTVFERMGDGYEAFAVLAATLEGIPLLYSGMEAGMNKRLEFFEKDVIDWSSYPYEEFYTKLFQLKHKNPAIWNANYGGDLTILTDNKDGIAYIRQKGDHAVLVLLNLSKNETVLNFNADTIGGKYTELFSGEQKDIKGDIATTLAPWAYKVYSK